MFYLGHNFVLRLSGRRWHILIEHVYYRKNFYLVDNFVLRLSGRRWHMLIEHLYHRAEGRSCATLCIEDTKLLPCK